MQVIWLCTGLRYQVVLSSPIMAAMGERHMVLHMTGDTTGKPEMYTFYQQALTTLREAQIPFLIGGAYAFRHYTGIMCKTKDLDLFVSPDECHHALAVLQAIGCHTELTSSHWLGKASCGEAYLDVIFSSGNGTTVVDELWFAHAVTGELFGLSVGFCPPEEMLWTKAYIMERERFDGADVAHLLRACGACFDWPRVLRRFGPHWRVLLSHLILFGFIYQDERDCIPRWVMQELIDRLQHEAHAPLGAERVCLGTLLSRAQYLVDIDVWGYHDARRPPTGQLTAEDVAQWTAAMQRERNSS
jgi:hypothetical protein